MEDHNDDLPPAQPVDYTGASRGELLEALKVAQQENTGLRAEICYKSQVVAWAKRSLFTRALFIDITMFCAKPSETALDPATIFATDDLYTESLTIALYQEIPAKFHELLDYKHSSGSMGTLAPRSSIPFDFDLLTTAGADRTNNTVLSGLLKFPTEKKATLYAPVLLPGPTQNMTKLFLGPVVKKVHRLMYFGPGSLIPESKPASNSNSVRLGFKTVTESSISAAATLVHPKFC
ncbi:hypothetical protein B0H11DRAFT_1928551 [Mycena galericulata]|nr:hypothetical protein B0H11DRAFT_1928551 [Mycena galericulata]